MEKKEMTCIRCPMGCRLTVTKNGDDYAVSGNTCRRGEEYGVQEMSCPMRVVTSSVRVTGGVRSVCSVKTAQSVPKAKIDDVLKALAELRPAAPIAIGQVLATDIAETGVALVATANDRAAG